MTLSRYIANLPSRLTIVNRFLTSYFTQYVDYGFTASLEDELDAVSRGEEDWVPLLQKFWRPFKDKVDHTQDNVRRSDVTQEKIDEIIYAAGTDYTNKISRVGAAFLFAIETGMRAGEIAGLEAKHVDLDRKVAHLTRTKNGTARDVPLSGKAVRILKEVGEFNLTTEQISSLFRKIKGRTLIKDLTFHDTCTPQIFFDSTFTPILV